MNTEFDRHLDAALRQAFVPPEPATFAAMAQAAARPVASRWRWPLVVAAAALFAVVLQLAWPRARGPEGHDGHQLGALWAAAYADAVDRGFEEHGMGGCCMGLDMAQACRDRFACGLALAQGSQVTVLGEYDGRPTGGSMALVAKAGDVPLCVYILPKGKDPRVRLPRDCNLRLGRRDLGDLVLYAVSKQPAEAALAAFVVP
ncbi:MAG: hypothetical protein JNN13_06810 [Planctomycetes bacterium]|nr:hypothetical protein [Planctomycetota bacterium]